MTKWVLTAAMLGLLASCGPPQPRMETTYEIVPPKSESARAAANDCLRVKQQGEQFCAAQRQECDRDMQWKAQSDYDRYVFDRQRLGLPLNRTPQDFDDAFRYGGNRCNAAMQACLESTNSNYQLCHTNTGGKVVPHTACVENCHLLGQPQPVR